MSRRVFFSSIFSKSAMSLSARGSDADIPEGEAELARLRDLARRILRLHALQPSLGHPVGHLESLQVWPEVQALNPWAPGAGLSTE